MTNPFCSFQTMLATRLRRSAPRQKFTVSPSLSPLSSLEYQMTD
jgi:hypothetical protein